jgi:UDP-GlcNAc:undecaprenyl-phosphate GlcNAc-1-phosphate transferase
VARSGGLTIACALLLALLAQMGVAREMGLESYLADADTVYLLLPALVLLGLGLFDDLTGLGAKVKLIVQALCALWAWVLGFRIDEVTLFGLALEFPLWAQLPLTMIFLIAVTNAFNMLDGIDGLCTGAAFVALAGIGAYTQVGGDLQFGLALPMAAAALAFLRLNFARPKAFLGDSGSTFLGFVVAALALKAVRAPGGELALAPLLLVLSLPVVDITSVVLRRVLQGSNPLAADRGHIHHVAIILFGDNVPRATITLLLIASIAAAGAVVAGLQPALALALVVMPLGLYALIYARGGYLSPRNLLRAGRAAKIARSLALSADEIGPGDALTSDKAIKLMELLRVTAIGLLDERQELTWCLGVPDMERDALELPMYAGGKVRKGILYVQGPGRGADHLAFAAQLMIPLYPALMQMLESRTRATRKIPKRVKV